MPDDPDEPDQRRPAEDGAAADGTARDGTTRDDTTRDDAAEDGAAADGAAAETEREWWDDPRMPWKGKPGRSDLICWGLFSFIGIISLVLLPLRPLLLEHPYALASITGSRTAMVIIGALTAVGQTDLWWVALIVATVSTMKWDPIFWWAGRLWGRGLIEVIAGRSKRAARNAARAEKLAQRFGAAAILITYVVPVLPTAVIYASVGAAGMRLRTFIIVDLIGSFATRCLYLWIGYQIGEPAVEVLNTIDRYLRWVSIALLVVVMISVFRRRPGARSDKPAS